MCRRRVCSASSERSPSSTPTRCRGSSSHPEENDITNINAIVMGAKGTPLEGGFFHFYVQYTNLYPLEPPKVRSMTTDAGRVQFNEHIYKCFSICLSRLNTFGSTWTPAQTLSSLLLSIQWLLCDVQKLKDKAVSDSFESILQHETIRVAVCDTVEACLQDNSPLTQTLKDVVLENFTELYRHVRRRGKVDAAPHGNPNERPRLDSIQACTSSKSC
ncbi:hypothetical protein MTO96_003309 [Rhipicephalus appendiculatus]